MNLAEFIATSEKDLALNPVSLTMEEGAAVPLVALTAWQVLVERAKLKGGQTVFVQAGSGGVGTIAINSLNIWGRRSSPRRGLPP